MTSLTWPDPLFAQAHYRFQYKRPAQGAFTKDNNAPARIKGLAMRD